MHKLRNLVEKQKNSKKIWIKGVDPGSSFLLFSYTGCLSIHMPGILSGPQAVWGSHQRQTDFTSCSLNDLYTICIDIPVEKLPKAPPQGSVKGTAAVSETCTEFQYALV